MTDTITVDEYRKMVKKRGSKHEQAFVAAWELFKTKGVPDPEREQVLMAERKDRCDFVWRSARLVVEIDGGQWKAGGGRHNTDRDRDKINSLTIEGWRVLRYSGTLVQSDPQGVVRQVCEAYLRLKGKRK